MRLSVFASLMLFFLIMPGLALAWEDYTPVNMDVYVQSIEEGNIIMVSEYRNAPEDAFAIRLYGIGMPLEGQPCAAEALAKLKELLPVGDKIIISTVNKDEEGVISALVQHDDRSVNNRLIDDGLAWVDRFTCKAFFCRRWHIQEHLAIKEKKGVWALNISTPPWQWGRVPVKKGK